MLSYSEFLFLFKVEILTLKKLSGWQLESTNYFLEFVIENGYLFLEKVWFDKDVTKISFKSVS